MQGLPTEYYTSQEIFERERERLFGRLWLFAGLKMMVNKSGAYYARRLAGRPIVLQNLGGEIACFLNSCAHLNAEVQPEGFGVRGLVCAYHGFRYAIDGKVASIPMEETHFRFTPEQRRCLKLRRFALEQVGQFLFVNFADSPRPLREQFSDTLLAELEGVSSSFDTDVIHATHTGSYNWKLPGENLRDLMHVRTVHPQTLHPWFDFESHAVAERPITGPRPALRDLSFGSFEGVAKVDMSWPYWDQLERWPGASDGYSSWLVFPNLHVVSPHGGRTFGIEQFDPLSASSTRLVHFMMTARRKTPIPHGDAVLRTMLRNARMVLDEDVRIMESAQRGMVPGSPTMQHAANEKNMNHFVQVSRELLDG